MFRIRFHGRGGHGMKTASRIVGTAAFLEGYYVQDFPLYGAERRGAPITAYTRISNEPVLERGIVTDPDVVVIADDSLIEDPQANPLRGVITSTLILVNTTSTDIKEKLNVNGPANTIDITGICLEIIGKGTAISAAIAGATCKILGIIKLENVKMGIIKELQIIGISKEVIEKNIEAAVKSFDALPSYKILPREITTPVTSKIFTISYQEPSISSPSVYASGNIVERQTGKWRIFKPIINLDECNKCWICFVRCPEGVISLDDEEYPYIDYEHCKGCLICHEECPVKAITVEREAHKGG